MHDYATMPLKEMRVLPGISDLPTNVAAPFMLALKAEAKGDHATAETKLNEAVEKIAAS